MEAVTGGINEMIMVNLPLGKEERENLIKWATNILKEETDDEVLASVFELLRDLNSNVGMREGLKSFRKNGWAFIRKTQKRYEDVKLQNIQTSTSTMRDRLQQAKLIGNLESRLDHETHPLNNDVILKKVFDLSSVKDLKNCRLVSKKWCNLSLSSWRRKAVLKTQALFEENDEHFDKDNDAATQQFIQNASKFLEVPFQFYDITVDHQHFSLSFLSSTEKKKMMLDFFSSSIHNLTFECDSLNNLSTILTKLPELRVLNLQLQCQTLFRQYDSIMANGGECPFQNLQPVTSKLHKLELDLVPLYPERRTNFPWKKIFESFPALKCLRLDFHHGISSLVQGNIIQSVCEVRREGNFSTLELEELTIYDLYDAVVSRVAESQFPLRSLYIEVGDRNKASTISDLLKNCGETLQYIKCGFGSDQECRRILFQPYLTSKVKLPSLKELVLETGIAFSNFLCSIDVPNLEELTIERNDFIRKEYVKQEYVCGGVQGLESKTFRNSCIFPNLKKFIFNETGSFTAKELRVLAKAMPNVGDIRIPLGHQTFPVICEVWPGIESIHLAATEITYLLLDDYAITGFSVPNYCEDDVREDQFRVPNITNLKNLKKFVLKTKLHGGRNLLRPRKAWVTDFSAVHGFLHVPKLQVLEIETVCKFSPSVMVAMKDHISEITIRDPYIFAFVPVNSCNFEYDRESSSDESVGTSDLD